MPGDPRVDTSRDKATHYRERSAQCQHEAERAVNERIAAHYRALAKTYSELAEAEDRLAKPMR